MHPLYKNDRKKHIYLSIFTALINIWSFFVMEGTKADIQSYIKAVLITYENNLEKAKAKS